MTWNNETVQAWTGIGALGTGVIVLALIALALVRMLWKGTIDDKLLGFISEDGEAGRKPSSSRLQMLVWNFVVGFAFLYLLAKRDDLQAALAALLQPNVLLLLGISNGTYVAGKLIGSGPAEAAPALAGATGRGDQPPAVDEGPGPQGR
jgi:hypothetical protein